MNTASPHPGPLVLGFAGQHVRVDINPHDPYALVIRVKHSANLDREILRDHQRVFGRPVGLKEVLPNTAQLWLGNTVIELEPHHVDTAQAWCQRYADWTRDGTLPAQQVAA